MCWVCEGKLGEMWGVWGRVGEVWESVLGCGGCLEINGEVL